LAIYSPSGADSALALSKGRIGMLAKKYSRSVIALVSVVALVALLVHGRIPQDPAYHLFADTRTIAGIGNFWNVLSNLPFLLFGLYGLSRIGKLAEPESKSAYVALCLGVLLVGFGSAYYHYSPSWKSLIWDRLPMTIAFMALFAMLLDERKVLDVGPRILWPLLVVGIGSVAYWYWTETQGAGDLRPYVLVQFLPIALIPIILLLFDGKYLGSRLLIAALVLYFAAKALEYFDQQIFRAIGIVSGHTLKHLVAGIAVLCIILAVPVRNADR
jgi:hypothetical protein